MALDGFRNVDFEERCPEEVWCLHGAFRLDKQFAETSVQLLCIIHIH